MENTEIERKFLIKEGAFDYSSFPYHELEQGYLNVKPAIRVRKEDDTYYMTYKGKGVIAHTEYNLPLTKEAYEHLLSKADGNIIRKRRYLIPYEKYTIELDVFEEPFAPLILAEVEFDTKEEAENFVVPGWFEKDVTANPEYHNSNMSCRIF